MLDPGLTSRAQSQVIPLQASPLGATNEGASPATIAGVAAPNPYPLAMAAASSPPGTGSTAAGTGPSGSSGSALREGPLNPNFRVEEQVPERYSMGRGSVQVAPGNEVCLDPTGCGSGVNADQLSTLEIEGPASLVSAEDPSSDRPAFRISAIGNGLLSWLHQSRR